MEKETKLSVYEIGYILVPSIAEENVGSAVTDIKDMLLANGATFIADEYPKMMELAYQMERSIANKKAKFTTGYFGWVKFEVDASVINTIKDIMDKNESVIRFLLIKTVRESTLAPKRAYTGGARRKVTPKDESKAGPINEEVIDKEIDALVVE